MNENTKHRVASEIVITLKILLMAFIGSLLFLMVYFFIMKPPTSNPDIRHMEHHLDFKERLNYGEFFSNYSPYDQRIVLRRYYDNGQAVVDDINKQRQAFFNADLIEKGLYVFLWLFLVILFGRYVLKSVRWINRYA